VRWRVAEEVEERGHRVGKVQRALPIENEEQDVPGIRDAPTVAWKLAGLSQEEEAEQADPIRDVEPPVLSTDAISVLLHLFRGGSA